MEEGEILGFLGPNGAGKTTTLNMLSTLLKPSSGSATVNGHNIVKKPDAVRRSIGYVFQDPTLDLELTGKENLDFHGRLYHLDGELRQSRIEEILQHHNWRNSEILTRIEAEPKTAYQIAEGITWSTDTAGDGWQNLSEWDKRLAVLETLSHLEAMRADDRVDKLSENGIIYYRQS